MVDSSSNPFYAILLSLCGIPAISHSTKNDQKLLGSFVIQRLKFSFRILARSVSSIIHHHPHAQQQQQKSFLMT